MYDLIIIGAGPGGYVAGIRSAQLGLKACLIEKQKVGGVCLNVGCIPTKNLIHQAQIFQSGTDLEKMGIRLDTKGFDYTKVYQQSQAAVSRLVKGVEHLIKKNKIEFIKGRARITSKSSVKLEDGTEIRGRNIMIATGSRPLEIPGFEFDEKRVLSSTGILSQKKLPKKLIILGGGAIGCEFAYILSAFGVKITLVEMMDHLLPFEDGEIVSVLEESFKQSGIEILTGTRAVSLKKTSKTVAVKVEDRGGNCKDIKADQVLCVFGRTPNTDDIGLENIGLSTQKGYIPVGDCGHTMEKGIFAVGDVVATPLLAHVASKEAEIAVDFIAGRKTEVRIDVDAVPSAIYCDPQVASFGLRENEAREQNIAYNKAIFPYQGVGKAVAIDKAEGMLKILTDPETDEILGAHIVGHEATELIHEMLLAKTSELCSEDIANMMHAHPTISEVVMEGMREVKGGAIHI